jgi:hypothetical protein
VAGNEHSGRRARPAKPNRDLTALRYLKQTVQDEAAPRRDRGAAARAILNHQARTKRERRMTSKDEQWQEVLEAGWWSHWHCGWGENSKIGSDHYLYGYNLLQLDQPPRDPRVKPYRVQHPPEHEYRQMKAREWEKRTGQTLPPLPEERQDPNPPPDDE